MDCQEYIESFLSAHADGELSADEARDVSRHLAGCANCSARLASERALKAALRKRVPIVSTPAGVRREIAADLQRSARPSISDRIRAFTPVLRWAPAAIAAVLIVIAFVGRYSQTPAIPAFDHAIAGYDAMQKTFAPSVPPESGMAFAYPNSEWISKQIGVTVSAWNFDKAGYRFVGSRAARLADGRPVVYTLYKGPKGQIVCSFQRSSGFPIPPGGETVNNVHHFYRYKDMSVCLTAHGAMVCILISRMPMADFIRTIKQVES